MHQNVPTLTSRCWGERGVWCGGGHGGKRGCQPWRLGAGVGGLCVGGLGGKGCVVCVGRGRKGVLKRGWDVWDWGC